MHYILTFIAGVVMIYLFVPALLVGIVAVFVAIVWLLSTVCTILAAIPLWVYIGMLTVLLLSIYIVMVARFSRWLESVLY